MHKLTRALMAWGACLLYCAGATIADHLQEDSVIDFLGVLRYAGARLRSSGAVLLPSKLANP